MIHPLTLKLCLKLRTTFKELAELEGFWEWQKLSYFSSYELLLIGLDMM